MRVVFCLVGSQLPPLTRLQTETRGFGSKDVRSQAFQAPLKLGPCQLPGDIGGFVGRFFFYNLGCRTPGRTEHSLQPWLVSPRVYTSPSENVPLTLTVWLNPGISSEVYTVAETLRPQYHVDSDSASRGLWLGQGYVYGASGEDERAAPSSLGEQRPLYSYHTALTASEKPESAEGEFPAAVGWLGKDLTLLTHKKIFMTLGFGTGSVGFGRERVPLKGSLIASQLKHTR